MNLRIQQLATGILAAGSIASADSMPVAPIDATTWGGISNVFHLRNERADVVIAPDLGRIAHAGLGTNENAFRFDARASGDFANYGGDWFWPVAQAHWPSLNGGRDWPPPALLEQRPWLGNAWKSADSAQHCLIRMSYGPPLNIIVSRKIELERDATRVTIVQRIERTDESTVPVTLWNISQVQGAERAILPGSADALVSLGFKPTDGLITSCSNAIVFDTKAGTEHKFGSTSPKGWIAAQRGGVVILEKAETDADGTYPDKNSRVTLYSNSGLGYTEIETLSPEKNLKKGESLQNRLTIDLVRVDAGAAACDVAEITRARAESSP